MIEDHEENEDFVEIVLDTPAKDIEYDSDPFDRELDPQIRATLGASVKKQLTRMKKRYAGKGDAESTQIQDSMVTGYNTFDVVLPPYNMGYLAKLYEISAPHMAAVDAKVYNTVGLGYDFVETWEMSDKLEEASEEEAEKLRRKIERAKRKLRALLDEFNEDDLFVETLIKAVTDQEATGNGYIEVGRTSEGNIGYIGHIPSQTVRVRRERDGFVQLIANKAEFFRNFGDTETPNPLKNNDSPNEIIHLKTYSPTNGYYGVPKIVSAKTSLAGNEFAGKYNLDYFENKAVPRYIIVTKGTQLSRKSQERLLQFFSSNLKGQNHRSIYIPLPSDKDGEKVEFDMKAVEAGIQDSSFSNYRKNNLSDILMAHRVPLSKVSTSESVSLAQAKDSDKTFKEQVCRPAQRILEKKINKIISELTNVVTLRFNELELSDENTQSQIDERYLRNQVLTPNEVRARKGLPGLEGGDKVIELKAQQKADQRANAGKTRARDSERSANQSDSQHDSEGRNAKGDGRRTA